MKVLVTGSAGFIGSYVVDLLVKKGETVYGVDDMSGGFWRNINPKCKFEKLNLVNKKKTAEFVRKVRPEVVYHLAADATEGRSHFTPISCTERNYLAFLNTIVPAIKFGLKKFVFVSSMSVYGMQKTPFTEEMETKPEDIYAIAKTASENALKIFSEVFKINYSITRAHNVYGPRQNLSDPYRNVVGIFINSLLAGRKYYIYGDGEQKRSFSYIDDVAPYIVQLGNLNKYNGETFNIGPEETVTINELSNIVLKSFYGGKEKISKKMLPIYLPERPKEVKIAYCSNKKVRDLLNYKPKINLEQGIKLMIEWAKKLGPQKFHYLKNLELVNESTPRTWREKLLK